MRPMEVSPAVMPRDTSIFVWGVISPQVDLPWEDERPGGETNKEYCEYCQIISNKRFLRETF